MEKDIDLLKRIANADELAFKHFYDKYVNKVYQFIFNFVRDKAEAEDITQIVFIKIWSKKSTIDSINSLDGFVFTIAHRSVIDYFRSSETNFKKQDKTFTIAMSAVMITALIIIAVLLITGKIKA